MQLYKMSRRSVTGLPQLQSGFLPRRSSKHIAAASTQRTAADKNSAQFIITQQLERILQSNAADKASTVATVDPEQRLYLEAHLSSPEATASQDSVSPLSSLNTDGFAQLQILEPEDQGQPSWIPTPIVDLYNHIPPRVRGLLMLNGLVLLVATNWVVVKQEGQAFDPFLFAALRFGVASLAFSPFLLKALKDPKLLTAGAELGLWSAIGYLAQAEGLMTTDASRASFLSTFTVLIVPFLAGLSGRGISLLTWVSAGAALVGVSLLEQSGSPPSIGDAWSILSAIGFGIQMFRTEHWSRVIGKGNTLPLMSVTLGCIAVFATAAAVGTHVDDVVHLVQQPQVVLQSAMCCSIPWKQVMYTGLLTTDVALLLEIVALRDVSSVEASILYTLEPVLGAAFAFWMLGESFGPTGWAGASLILASCILTQVYGTPDDSFVMPKDDSKSD